MICSVTIALREHAARPCGRVAFDTATLTGICFEVPIMAQARSFDVVLQPSSENLGGLRIMMTSTPTSSVVSSAHAAVSLFPKKNRCACLTEC